MKSKKNLAEKRLVSKTNFIQGLSNIAKQLETIGSIELAMQATSVFEKILWITFFIVGIGWLGYFMKDVINDENPKTSIRLQKRINDLEYPGITICSDVTAKYAIVEHLGNHLDPSAKLPPKIDEIVRQIFLVFIDQDVYNYETSCVKENDVHTSYGTYCKVFLNYSLIIEMIISQIHIEYFSNFCIKRKWKIFFIIS